MNRLTKRPMSEKTTQITASIVLGAMGLGLAIRPAQAVSLTLQDVTEASIMFSGAYSGIQEESSFTSVGVLRYSDTPLEGTFYQGSVDGPPLIFIFVSDPADLPEGFLPYSSFSVSAEQNFRLVNQLSFTFPSSSFGYGSELTSGSTFTDVFLFRPASTPTFPPGDGALLGISTGDSRFPGLGVDNYWFLGDTGPLPQRQLAIFSNGGFFGFDQAPDSSGQIVGLGGTWQAKAVPEPVSVLGAAVAIVSGICFKRRQTR